MTGGRLGRRELLKATGGSVLLAGVGPVSVGAADDVATGPTVYVGSADRGLLAVDAATGEEVWAFTAPHSVVYTPTVVDGTVYVGSADNSLYAVDAATGEAVWASTGLDGFVSAAPTVVDGTVYVGSRGGALYAVDAATGEAAWTFTEPDGIPAAASVKDGTVYVGSYDGTLYAVGADTGESIWTFTDPEYELWAPPTAVGGRVYVGSGDSNVYAVDADTGEAVWTFTEPHSSVKTAPTVVDGTVYVGSSDGSVYAVDAQTGDRRWECFASSEQFRSSPTVVDGTVYVGSTEIDPKDPDPDLDEGVLYAIDADTGEPVWAFTEPDEPLTSSPTVADGTVYIASEKGTLYAIEASTGTQNWSFSDMDGDTVTGGSSSPTVVDDPETGDSVGSRVRLGTLGHHDEFAFAERILIDQTASVVAPDQPVSFVATTVEESSADLEWTFGDGTTATGARVTHQYEDVGDYTVDVTSADASGTASVAVVDDVVITVEPETPTVGEPVRFEAVGDAAAYEWTFPDGTTATTGETVTIFEDTGEHVVELTADGDDGEQTASETVVVEASPIEFDHLEVSPDSTLTGVDVPLEFAIEATANGDEAIDEIRIEYDDDVVHQSPGDALYASISSGELELDVGANEFRIVAQGSDGSERTERVYLTQYVAGDALETFADGLTASGNVVEFAQDYVDVDVELTSNADLLPDNLPFDDTTFLHAVALLSTDGRQNLDTGGVTVKTDSRLGADVLGVAGLEFASRVGAESTVEEYTRDIRLTLFRIAGTVNFLAGPRMRLQPPTAIPTWVGDIPLPFGDDDAVELDVLVRPGVAFEIDDFDSPEEGVPPVVPVDGLFDSYNHLEASVEVEVKGVTVEPSLEGYLHTAGDVALEFDDAELADLLPFGLYGTSAPGIVPEGGEAMLDGAISLEYRSFSYELTLGDLLDLLFGFDSPSLSLGETRAEPDWTIYESADVASLVHDATASDASTVEFARARGVQPPVDAVDSLTRETAIERLTDRDAMDTRPALARRGESLVAVWEGHRDGAGPEDGRDVAVATRTDGAWSEPAYLTDATERGHHEPTVAAADDRVAAAWATVELAEEADSLGGIEVVVDDGDGWGEPVTLIDGDELDRLPALEPLGDDRWVVAWERTRPEGLAVVSAVIDDRGEVLTQETIEAAERPALAATDDGVALIYYDRAGEQVRRERLSAATEREPVAAYDAPTVEALAAGADVTAWIADAGPEPVVECATNGGDSSELTFPEAVSRVTTLDVVETARGTAVVYRRIVDDEAQSSFGYRLRRDGEWRPDRPFVAGRPDVTVWKPAVVPNAADDGFVAVLTGESRSDDGVADLFAVAHRFHATYELAHVDGPTGVAPGEAVTIEYTLHNVGELAGTEAVTVVARSDGEILAETTDEPLEPGQTAAGQLSVTLDETGTVDVLAAPGLSVSDPAPDVARASVTISTPALSVADVTLERPAADEASADVTVANDGPIDADGVGFALRSGDRLIAAGRVDGVPATGTAAATVAVDPAVVDDHVAEEIRLDPDDDLPASHVADPIASVLLGQPELVIDDRIAYHVVGSHVVARLLVVNAGTRATETTVRAIRAGAVPSADGFDDDVLLGTTTVTLPPTVGDTERAVSVEVPVGTVEEGDRLQFVLEPDRPVAGPGIPVVEDEVGTLFGGADDVRAYADEDGIVQTDGLRNAIDDWRSGAVETDLLRDTIDAWRSGEPIT